MRNVQVGYFDGIQINELKTFSHRFSINSSYSGFFDLTTPEAIWTSVTKWCKKAVACAYFETLKKLLLWVVRIRMLTRSEFINIIYVRVSNSTFYMKGKDYRALVYYKIKLCE
jgi:hypothetical protein